MTPVALVDLPLVGLLDLRPRHIRFQGGRGVVSREQNDCEA